MRPTRTLALLFVAACGGAAAPAAALPAPVTRFHQASGGDRWDQIDVLEETGTLTAGGMTGTYTTVSDLRGGRFRTEYALGPMRGADGYDGTAGWSQDSGGEVEVDDAAPSVARARTAAWLQRRDYLRAGGAVWRDLGARSERGVRHAVLEVTPEGGAPIELWFDDATGLLARTRHQEGNDTWVTALDDYREVDGVKLPFRTVIWRADGDPRTRQTVLVTKATVRGPAPETTWARPATDAARASFAGGATRSEIPFDLVNNHIYVDAQVDGKPVRMLVDTGGLNLLGPAAVARLGLKAEGKLVAGGAGDKEVDVGLATASTLTVGAVTLERPTFYVLDVPGFGDVEGVDFDGLVGFELFHRFVVRIDYGGRTLTLIARDQFQPPRGATAVKFEIDGRTPVATGSIDGIPARFTIDTGARNSLTTHSPFTREHKLVDRYKPRHEAIVGWGVGGPSRGHPVRFGEIRLGEVSIRDVVGDLFTGDKSSMADPDISANLGAGILRRFVCTFDYGNRTLYLEDGPERNARDTYDRFGAWLVRAHGGLRIIAVTAGAPAAKAGLLADDLITAVDGAAAASRALPDWRTQFRTLAPGTKLRIAYTRAGTSRDVVVTLAELLP